MKRGTFQLISQSGLFASNILLTPSISFSSITSTNSNHSIIFLIEHFHGLKMCRLKLARTNSKPIITTCIYVTHICKRNIVCVNLSHMAKHQVFCHTVMFKCCMNLLECQIKILSALTGMGCRSVDPYLYVFRSSSEQLQIVLIPVEIK